MPPHRDYPVDLSELVPATFPEKVDLWEGIICGEFQFPVDISAIF